MAKPDEIRIGFIGAGSIARTRHLPNLTSIPAVRVAAVCNRSKESSERVVRDFHIPTDGIVENWEDLVRRPDLDAVFIGTWPYMHARMSIAALQAGKHVFCQARMAMDLAEAKAMVAAASVHADLVNMICPPPTRMPFEPYIRQVLGSGRLGELTLVELLSVSGANLSTAAVHWRERAEFSGKQAMAMGIYAETLNAWVGPYDQLEAQTSISLPSKRDESGKIVEIRIPQVITITGRLASGALAVEHHLGLAADKSTPGDRLTIWGLKGTLRYGFGQTIELAAAGQELRPENVPPELRRDWWAEQEFIDAVRAARSAKPWSVTPDFAEGLLYMRKVEAVHLSAATGRAVRPAEL